ncbi:hypothetical protein PRK78_004749 [Emydomyces testavorans]|uniref:Aminoglycoside phosphotransferase domain-containing protein n=1 Tax=Emydomyces testavorans TaxID=2070801 RepID=A0AAF0DII5_9EURO|nr:hypothetical protein PRK78_004749 [Emydomyces testavorans]
MEASILALSKYQISQFFSETPVTQQQCDQEAERITGVSAIPSTVQGGSSYTVITGDHVVQFRASHSALDMPLLKCIEKIYMNFVPHHLYAGELDKLHIYKMNNIGGISMYLAREQLYQDNYRLLQQTLRDYAKSVTSQHLTSENHAANLTDRFFASAWHNRLEELPSPSRMMLFDSYSSQLRALSTGLPSQFHQILNHLLSHLPDLFADDWPMVPNHTDLLENNIHVDPCTGRLVSICDWKDTEIGPFGMSLGGLETMLGINRTKQGWCYHPNQQALRDLFWTAFNQAMGDISDERIEIARLVGIFLMNGWQYDEQDNKVPVWEGTHELAYLNAVVLETSTLPSC